MPMLDWLKRSPREAPSLVLAGRTVPVEVRRLAHARRLTLRLAPDGSAVRVTIPQWAPTAEALAFARSRAEWLEGQLARLPEPAPMLPGSVIPWRGAPRALIHDPAAPRRVRLLVDELHLGGPTESLAPRLRRWMQGEARQMFRADLADYAPRAEVAVPDLALSNAQRRWGSCSANGMVRLNWRLVMAPDFVRRSVVAHEVAHLVHFDHSPRFHALLGDIFEGEIDQANRWLKRHGRTLYVLG
jgi:predicted metal-dependent hydrolase